MSEISCCQCRLPFSIERIPRRMFNCPHSTCDQCLQLALVQESPTIVCSTCCLSTPVDPLAPFPVNEELLSSLSPTPNTTLSHPIIEQEDEQQDEGQCGEHGLARDVVCVEARKLVCAKCALFGPHRQHQLIPLQQFHELRTNIAHRFQDIVRNFSSPHHSPIALALQTMNKQKERMKKRVREHVEDWIQALKAQESFTIADIETLFGQIQAGLEVGAGGQVRESAKALQDWERACWEAVAQGKNRGITEEIRRFFDSPLPQLTNQTPSIFQSHDRIATKLEHQVEKYLKATELMVHSDMEHMIKSCFKIKSMYSTQPSFPSSLVSSFGGKGQFAELREATSKLLDEKSTTRGQSPPPLQIGSMKKLNRARGEKSPLLRGSLKVNGPEGMRLSASNLAIPGRMARANTSVMLPGQAPECSDYTEADRLVENFTRSKMSDNFELSDCRLPNEKVLEYVLKARQAHKIKGLKLSSNQIDNRGLEKLVEHLKGVVSVNLADNKLTQKALDTLINRRDQLQSLRVVNLEHNPMQKGSKLNEKVNQLKKQGVKVVL